MTTLLGNQLSDYDIQFSIDLRLVGSFCFKGKTRCFRGTSLSTQLQMSTGELSVKSDEFLGGRGELICIGLATHPWGGVAIHLVAPSHKDRTKPGPLSSSVHLTAKCKENYLQQTSRSVRSRC